MTPLLAQRPRTDRSFERIYRRHVGDVYRYALAVMRNPTDAEDVTQTTFLNAYRAFQGGERPEKAQNWLITIAHNVCRQRFRQSARRPKEVAFDDDLAAGLVVDDDVPSGTDIRRALGHLAFNQRAALVMRELEGRSYAEIAEILDLSTSAVETLIFRARRALREQLETSLTCGEAEFAISRQLDGRLERKEKGALRAHLRQCRECASFARRQRAQRTAFKALAVVPLPASLGSFFGGGAAIGTGLAIKAAAAVTAGLVIGGAGYEGARHAHVQRTTPSALRAAPATGRPSPIFAGSGLVPSPALRAAAGAPAQHASKPGAAAAKQGPDRGKSPSKAKDSNGKDSAKGDASIADRHRKQPDRGSSKAQSKRPRPSEVTAKGEAAKPVRSRAKVRQLPGPFDAGRPRGKGKDKRR